MARSSVWERALPTCSLFREGPIIPALPKEILPERVILASASEVSCCILFISDRRSDGSRDSHFCLPAGEVARSFSICMIFPYSSVFRDFSFIASIFYLKNGGYESLCVRRGTGPGSGSVRISTGTVCHSGTRYDMRVHVEFIKSSYSSDIVHIGCFSVMMSDIYTCQ